jgi:hypothetical protein
VALCDAFSEFKDNIEHLKPAAWTLRTAAYVASICMTSVQPVAFAQSWRGFKTTGAPGPPTTKASNNAVALVMQYGGSGGAISGGPDEHVLVLIDLLRRANELPSASAFRPSDKDAQIDRSDAS